MTEMDVQIKMPDLATTTNEMTLIRWLVEVGQPVRLGQPLLEIETDKALMEVESVAEGILKIIRVQPGDQVAVGQVIALIEKLGDSTPVSQPINASPNQVETIAHEPTTPAKPRSTGSLFDRNKRARQSTPEHQEIVLSATQRALARRLQESKQTIPHYYLQTSANAEGLAAFREAAKHRNPAQSIHWDAFFVSAAARALQAFDRMNYRFEDDRLVRRNTEAIGVAADIDGSLYVIPIEVPLSHTVEQISEQIGIMSARISQGDPAAKKLKETCITITNLGAEGIESFMAIINPPESAILAIGKVAPSVQPDGDRVIIQKRVSLSLSVDHRIANGKYAAAFLSRMVNELEAY
jgi:pyruvate dehydrogenase E2 component (dihydrolipoyllysine-residue acetyltransferase)